MKNLRKVYAVLTAFLIFSCTKTVTETIVEVEEFDRDIFYLSTSVCNCNTPSISFNTKSATSENAVGRGKSLN